MSYDFSKFSSILEQWQIPFSEKQREQLTVYYEMLVEKNKVMNLTAITEFEDVLEKHFLDSIAVARYVDLTGELCVIDLGTGAGFPGMPLKIMFPNMKITLADSLNKRILFLNEVVDALKLEGVTTVHGRAEDLAADPNYREQYDYCVSRAVANLSTLSEYCLPFVKKGGMFISYKSEKIAEEAVEAKKSITILGGKVNRQIELYLPNSDIYRNLFIIDKISKCPNKYPRKAGLPSKEPLR